MIHPKTIIYQNQGLEKQVLALAILNIPNKFGVFGFYSLSVTLFWPSFRDESFWPDWGEWGSFWPDGGGGGGGVK